jgi:hypothetical protein
LVVAPHALVIPQKAIVVPPETVTARTANLGLPARSSLPPAPEAQEPYQGAWLQEGNVVEANYNSYTGGKYDAMLVFVHVGGLLNE